jgi:aminoglycoside/choline kinase family phosphotransferase/dTDP-glucose pyrophosphorylase
MLESWGVEEIAINAHWRADDISRYVAERNISGGAKIIVSREDEILGTGGALIPLRGFISDDPFWLVNGDIVEDGLKPELIVKAFEESGNFAGCWISDKFGPRTIEVDYEGRVCNWASDVAGDWGTFTYCGCALLSPEVIKYLPSKGFSSIVSAYEKAMMEDAKFVVGANVEDAWWNDAGTFESYLESQAALDPDRFESNPNVILPGVKLLESAELAGCVVTSGLIGGEFERVALVGVQQLQDEKLTAVTKALSWPIEDTAAEFMGTRGSDRTFWRLVYGDERAIAIIYDDEARPENALYSAHARMLSKVGIPVPRVLADIPEKKVLAIEDCGRESLQDIVSARGVDVVKIYKQVVQALAKFHTLGTEAALSKDAPKLNSAFGPELYKWERGLFEEFSVKGRYAYDGLPSKVVSELEGVAMELGKSRPVLVHRDFQSTNVLFRADRTFAFIDFQGMRLGCAAYDLASLLYDPYVKLDEKQRKILAKEYAAAAPELADVVKLLPMAAVQRLIQALGAFGRLASVGQEGFLKYISNALDNLLAAADEADLDAVGAYAEELISRENYRQGHIPHHHHDDDEEIH